MISTSLSNTLISAANQDVQFEKENLSNLYSPRFLRLIQIIYGTEGIISQGGVDALETMFSGIDLYGKKILDVGSGFGGIDTYLAKNYNVNIIGVDCEPYMIMQANKLLESKKSMLKGQVSFQILNQPTSLKEFPNDTFDIVYCKEVLYHLAIPVKQEYVNEMYRVLKPGGKIVVADWLKSTPEPGEWLQLSLNKGRKGFCHYITPQDLHQMIEKSNFQGITFVNVSESHVKYTKNDIERINNNIGQINQEFGADTTATFLEKWNIWLLSLKSNQLVAGIFRAQKN